MPIYTELKAEVASLVETVMNVQNVTTGRATVRFRKDTRLRGVN